MKCPKCHQGMKEKGDNVTNNGKKDAVYKEYKRNVYWCKEDDVWISVEVPLFPILQS